jgi:bifunctional non-homologous end joining protein LigD
MKAMTFHAATDADLQTAIQDPSYAIEPKLDGVRCVAHVSGGVARLLNRNAKPLAAASCNAARGGIINQLEADFPSGEWVLDGEIMPDGKLWLFDLPNANGVVTEDMPFRDRREALEKLEELVGWDDTSAVHVVSHAATSSAKKLLVELVIEHGAEGVMIKHLDRAYTSGRVKHSLKYKLTATADVIITARNVDGHTNAELGLFDDEDRLVRVGRVSMIGRPDVPVGTVLEVKFLYVGAGGRLYQPRVVGVRNDKQPAECRIHQIADLTVNKVVVDHEAA